MTSPNQNQTMPVAFPTGKQYGFYFDQGRCIGCQNCMLACNEWNGNPPGAAGRWMRVYHVEAGAFPNVQLRAFAIPCYHCEEPVCVDRANGSMYKEPKYGAVLIDPDKNTDPELRDAERRLSLRCNSLRIRRCWRKGLQVHYVYRSPTTGHDANVRHVLRHKGA